MSKKIAFGMEVVLDLFDCDPKIIRSGKALTEYADKICKILKMKKYGKTQIPHFGLESPHTAGYSLLQFIETSSITGHFSELWNSAYLNIFSCQKFDAKKAINFTVKFFKAKKFKARKIDR